MSVSWPADKEVFLLPTTSKYAQKLKQAGIPIAKRLGPNVDLVVEEHYRATPPAAAKGLTWIKTSWLDDCLAAGERVGLGSRHKFRDDQADDEDAVLVSSSESEDREVSSEKSNSRKRAHEETEYTAASAKTGQKKTKATASVEEGAPNPKRQRPTSKATAVDSSRRFVDEEEEEEAPRRSSTMEIDEQNEVEEDLEMARAIVEGRSSSSNRVATSHHGVGAKRTRAQGGRAVPRAAENSSSDDSDDERESDEQNDDKEESIDIHTVRLEMNNRRERQKRMNAPVERLPFEVFLRYGSTMPVWPEDRTSCLAGKKADAPAPAPRETRPTAPQETPSDAAIVAERRTRPWSGPKRPTFPLELLDVPQSKFFFNGEKGQKRYRPEEDAALLVWMIRAYPLFGTEPDYGLTSFMSPCLWHWAEQNSITNRSWESMKSRARNTLISYITGKTELPQDVWELLRKTSYFRFSGHNIVGFDRDRIDTDNYRSATMKDAAARFRNLKPAPEAVPKSRVSRTPSDNASQRQNNGRAHNTESGYQSDEEEEDDEPQRGVPQQTVPSFAPFGRSTEEDDEEEEDEGDKQSHFPPEHPKRRRVVISDDEEE